ncbi:hypothetical protein CRENBAI_012499 [Crenichthys baileyi]|uniref:Uncharacterized protein n=1 Tax=Crenichthys baileyi TaxID=28760 RepID=A0AAV9QY10_9TELE
MSDLPSDLEVVPSPLLLEEMEREAAQRLDGQEGTPLLLLLSQFSSSGPASPCCRQVLELAPAGPGSGRGTVNLFTFLSWEVEKALRRSAGLSVPRSAYDGSRLTIPCPGIGPLSHRSSSPPLHTAVKPSSSSHRNKCWRGAPSCVSAGEEESPMAAAVTSGAVVSLLADYCLPGSLAALPMPSSLAPARSSEATPDELVQRLRFYARQLKDFRRVCFLNPSLELEEKVKKMEEGYETAVRQFDTHAKPPEHCSLLQSSPRQVSRAVLQLSPSQVSRVWCSSVQAEQSSPGLQNFAAAAQLSPGLQNKEAAPAYATEDLGDASAPAHATEGLGDAIAPAQATEGSGDASTPAQATEGPGDASAPAQVTEGLGDASAPAQATEGPGDASAPAQATEGRHEA